jgi:hypothetical protein
MGGVDWPAKKAAIFSREGFVASLRSPEAGEAE